MRHTLPYYVTVFFPAEFVIHLLSVDARMCCAYITFFYYIIILLKIFKSLFLLMLLHRLNHAVHELASFSLNHKMSDTSSNLPFCIYIKIYNCDISFQHSALFFLLFLFSFASVFLHFVLQCSNPFF